MESFMKFNDEFMSQYGDNFGYSRMWKKGVWVWEITSSSFLTDIIIINAHSWKAIATGPTLYNFSYGLRILCIYRNKQT